MKYKELEIRAFNNLGISKESAKDIEMLRYDFADTLRDMYRRSQAPRKAYRSGALKSITTLTEDFADATLESNIANIGYDVTSGNAKVLENNTGTLTITSIESWTEITYSAKASVLGAGETTINLSLYNHRDEIIWTVTDTLTDTALTTFSHAPGIEIQGLRLEILLTVPTGWTDAYIDGLSIKSVQTYIQMPSDFFIPLEVKFTEGAETRYISKEMTPEEYFNWNPNISSLTSGQTLSFDAEDVKTYYRTDENLDYDGMMGFYFEYLGDQVRLYFKPKFDGLVEVYYTYIPTIQTKDKDLEINELFSDILVDGACIRGLRRKLLEIGDKMSEAMLIAIRTASKDYKASYDRNMAEFIRWTMKEADTPQIRPFDMFSDTRMELI